MSDWVYMMSEWVYMMSEWVYMMSDWVYMMSEWWVNECICKWMSVYVSEWVYMMSDWVYMMSEWWVIECIWWVIECIWWVNAVSARWSVSECVWRMLGECRCERLPQKYFVTLLCKLLCVTIPNFCIRLFENKLKLRLYTLHTLYNRCILYILCITDLYFTYSV